MVTCRLSVACANAFSEAATPSFLRKSKLYCFLTPQSPRLPSWLLPTPILARRLRRYWLPISFCDDVQTDEPKIVRRLAEDLLLFRDQFGRVGLTEPNCPHRGTSLEYGWIEAGGIRCCYHGWVYDVTGRCIEQPG